MRRSFYEQHGGFLPGLMHTADYEMWTRAISLEGGVASAEVLAAYRIFAANDSSRLARTAENVRDVERIHQILAARHPDYEMSRSVLECCVLARKQAKFFAARNDPDAARANWDYWKKNAPLNLRLRNFARIMLNRHK